MISAHVGQAEVAALEKIRKLLVVESQQAEDGRMDIISMHRVLDSLEADFVRGSDNPSPPKSRGGESNLLILLCWVRAVPKVR